MIRTAPMLSESNTIGFDRWTNRHSYLLALLKTPQRARYLTKDQRDEVQRLCRFGIGDRVRTETIGWLNRTYDNVRGHLRDAKE